MKVVKKGLVLRVKTPKKLKKVNQYRVPSKTVDLKEIKIAIDGYSGTGKSSTAKEVAKRLNYRYIDTGAMYRAVTLQMIRKNIDPEDDRAIAEMAGSLKLRFPESTKPGILVNDEFIDQELRSSPVRDFVSVVAAVTEVRREMVRQQKQMGESGGIVMDGRDIGTMVFPDADLKVFVNASLDVRAKRRQLELIEMGIDSDLESIKKNLLERDRIDSSRDEGPLRKAEGALEIDTTDLTFEDQVNKIVEVANRIINEG